MGWSITMPLAPPTTNRREHNERPLASFPANALPSGRAKQLAWARPDGNLTSVVIVFVTGKRRFAEVKNDYCCDDVTEQGNHRCGEKQ